LPYGIPSHDTFGRVLNSIEPEQLKVGFLAWIGEITEKLNIELIHIDGKTAKGSYDREEKLKALHTVSAWSSEHGLMLAQEKVDTKSNEITAVPILLKLLNLKGTIVTLDAMGTQTEIAKQIIEEEGDYVLALKGNQGKLSQQIESWFEQAEKQNWTNSIEYSYYEKVESGHHRIETRQIWTVPVSQLPPLHRQNLWPGLTTVVMLRSTRQLWNKTTIEVRFFISSLTSNAQKHAQVIRSHWGKRK
jgi:predicted transposase YbfD/YdcC